MTSTTTRTQVTSGCCYSANITNDSTDLDHISFLNLTVYEPVAAQRANYTINLLFPQPYITSQEPYQLLLGNASACDPVKFLPNATKELTCTSSGATLFSALFVFLIPPYTGSPLFQVNMTSSNSGDQMECKLQTDCRPLSSFGQVVPPSASLFASAPAFTGISQSQIVVGSDQHDGDVYVAGYWRPKWVVGLVGAAGGVVLAVALLLYRRHSVVKQRESVKGQHHAGINDPPQLNASTANVPELIEIVGGSMNVQPTDLPAAPVMLKSLTTQFETNPMMAMSKSHTRQFDFAPVTKMANSATIQFEGTPLFEVKSMDTLTLEMAAEQALDVEMLLKSSANQVRAPAVLPVPPLPLATQQIETLEVAKSEATIPTPPLAQQEQMAPPTETKAPSSPVPTAKHTRKLSLVQELQLKFEQQAAQSQESGVGRQLKPKFKLFEDAPPLESADSLKMGIRGERVSNCGPGRPSVLEIAKQIEIPGVKKMEVGGPKAEWKPKPKTVDVAAPMGEIPGGARLSEIPAPKPISADENHEGTKLDIAQKQQQLEKQEAPAPDSPGITQIVAPPRRESLTREAPDSPVSKPTCAPDSPTVRPRKDSFMSPSIKPHPLNSALQIPNLSLDDDDEITFSKPTETEAGESLVYSDVLPRRESLLVSSRRSSNSKLEPIVEGKPLETVRKSVARHGRKSKSMYKQQLVQEFMHENGYSGDSADKGF
ncbi:hypothetical protein HDU98_010898 [Podochytrium sp. JEL0797]|nr:hypothetical protein HDU98_010898 [Podochytrium sp. JEL0797]